MFLCSSRCQYVVTEAFKLWNTTDCPRHFHGILTLDDVDEDYQPKKQVHSIVK